MTEYVVDRENVWPYGSHHEEIIRCRACKFLNPRNEECGGRNWCKRMSFEVTPDGFCAWAERREVEG